MENPVDQNEESIPFGQAIYDNIFLWLFISIAISAVSYNLWGLIDVFRTPVAP